MGGKIDVKSEDGTSRTIEGLLSINPYLREGEKAIFFLNGNGTRAVPFVGGFEGVIKIRSDGRVTFGDDTLVESVSKNGVLLEGSAKDNSSNGVEVLNVYGGLVLQEPTRSTERDNPTNFADIKNLIINEVRRAGLQSRYSKNYYIPLPDLE